MIRFSPNPNRANLIRWHEWGDEAFGKAQALDKPVMLFLTAFWCRFCQRMDEGAFSDEENIALLNAYFIAVRVEDTQRPDVNTRYNLNGWPTIAFMAPQGELLGATNYLPPEEFGTLLVRLHMLYQEKKDEIRSAARAASEEPASTTSNTRSGEFVNEVDPSAVASIIMDLADRVHGGYGRGQKFIQPEANDFLLSRYEATRDFSYLDHVCLTLDRMRAGEMHDQEEGGYFRTCSNADWSRPHREKLLGEQAGLLANCVNTFRLTRQTQYALMAEGIVGYIERKLSPGANAGFYGCEDFLRNETANDSSKEEYFTIIDHCVYTDANAQTIGAYLEAAETLSRPRYKERALSALNFLLDHSRSPHGGMFHYFDGAAHVAGLLNDQTRTGSALVKAYRITGASNYLDAAIEIADFILARLKNPGGGYYDLASPGPAYLSFRLTLIEQNGIAALFFLALAKATGKVAYRDAALCGLSAFHGDFSSYGVHASAYGQALDQFVNSR